MNFSSAIRFASQHVEHQTGEAAIAIVQNRRVYLAANALVDIGHRAGVIHHGHKCGSCRRGSRTAGGSSALRNSLVV
jgi:hypothetical protein